jgi:hypothetical protein
MSNKRLEHDLRLCVKYKVPIVISSLGAVPEVNAAVHSYGGIVLHDVINNRHANSAIRKGADGLIAVAAGAGGHAGTLSPFALVQEIREWFDGPLLLAGAIATGGAILAAEAMGADMAYIGSPFIATEEARASDAYKQAIVEGAAATSSIPTISPACTATTSSPRSRPPAWTRTTCRWPILRRWISSKRSAAPRPGRTSGAAARASAPSRPSNRSANSSTGWKRNIGRRANRLASELTPPDFPQGRSFLPKTRQGA